MTEPDAEGALDSFAGFLRRSGEWVQSHRPEIEGFVTWGVVATAGRQARLYVPLDADAWRTIADLPNPERDAEINREQQITTLYGPGGAAFATLRRELLDAPSLAPRRHEVAEVLDSLADRRYFIAVCGALPLVEYLLSVHAGRWGDPQKRLNELRDRLDDLPVTTDAQASLLVEMTAVEMLLSEVPAVWERGPQRIGAITDKLNRHTALHGSARGWDERTNATRAVLLLAATAKVVHAMQSAEGD